LTLLAKTLRSESFETETFRSESFHRSKFSPATGVTLYTPHPILRGKISPPLLQLD